MVYLQLRFTDGLESPWVLARFLEKFTQLLLRSLIYRQIGSAADPAGIFLEPRSAPLVFPHPAAGGEAFRQIACHSARFERTWPADAETRPAAGSAQPVYLFTARGTGQRINPQFYLKLQRLIRPILMNGGECLMDPAEEPISLTRISMNSPLTLGFTFEGLAEAYREYRFGHQAERRLEQLHKYEMEHKELEIQLLRERLEQEKIRTAALRDLHTLMDFMTLPPAIDNERQYQIDRYLSQCRTKDMHRLQELMDQTGLKSVDIKS